MDGENFLHKIKENVSNEGRGAFKDISNKGLMYTCDETILFREPKIIQAIKIKK